MSKPQSDTAGATIYNRVILGVYNVGVVWISNTFIWRCARHELLDSYTKNTATNHLDIGPGTGWYLDHLKTPPSSLTLFDLNANSLAVSRKALARLDPTCIEGNVLSPLSTVPGTFGSIGATYLFHCVPGNWATKGAAFGNLAAKLDADGVLFGATVLSSGVRHNVLARGLMKLYQRLGAFNNQHDSLDGLQTELDRHFDDTTVRCVGSVAVFEARGPRRLQ